MSNRAGLSIYTGLSTVAVALSIVGTPAAAQQQTRRFDISAGDLGQALRAFTRQADQEIMFSNEQVAGKRTKGVRGTQDPRIALQILLEGTKLYAAAENGTVLTLRQMNESRAPVARRQTVNLQTVKQPVMSIEPVQDHAAGSQPPVSADTPDTAAKVDTDIVVTGSRIVRNGYEAPTPTTVLSAEDIQLRSPSNVADYINQLPQLSPGNSPRTTVYSANTVGGGANLLNLRNLGVTRTLVLLDGRRVVSAGLNSAVDINLLPSNLLQRVDIVTGGASAAYGSDAVAGVVNFVLDTKFTGLKGNANYSITSRGDAPTFTGDLAFGTSFSGGRGHLLLSGNFFDGQGIDTPLTRGWYRPGYRLLSNPAFTPTNGQPGQIVRDDIGYSRATPGGLITTGPLRGTTFGPNGEIGRFNFGSIQNGDLQAGGTVEDTAYIWPLLPDERHWSTYGRLSYELTDSINAIFEGSWAGSDSNNWSSPYARQSNITVNIANPYLPAEIRQAMTASNVSTFTMGRLNYDLVTPSGHAGEATYRRRQYRLLGALEGSFLASGKWRAYYQHGRSDVRYTRSNNPIVSRYNQSIDVIANPATGGVSGLAAGTPICRSQLTAASNGCVPMNIFGIGAPSQASIAYVMGLGEGLQARQDLDIKQDVAAIDAQYEPFATWAGPVSIAAGFEYRKEQFSAVADALSLQSAWFTGNFGSSRGEFDVKEVFGEALVPLLRNSAVAKSLDLNGAIRRTDYSTSGAVTTWKAGLTWDLDDKLRLRGTRSRDIRAPNLSDLFAAGTAFQDSRRDPSQPGSPTVSTIGISGGNPNLKPEVAATWTAGGVYRPDWLNGFSVSVDYYRIKIRDAIVAIGAQQLIDQCYGAGVPQVTSSCNSIVQAPGRTGLTDATIFTGGVNAQTQSAEGIDYELAYRTDLNRIAASLPGAINVRLLINQRLKDETSLAGAITDRLWLSGSQKWTGLLTSTYSNGPSNTTVTVRYLGKGKVSTLPFNNVLGVADEVNHFGSTAYVELAENVDFEFRGGKATLYAVVENLLDRDPEVIPGSSASFGTTTQYDLLGRTFRMGFRFRF